MVFFGGSVVTLGEAVGSQSRCQGMPCGLRFRVSGNSSFSDLYGPIVRVVA